MVRHLNGNYGGRSRVRQRMYYFFGGLLIEYCEPESSCSFFGDELEEMALGLCIHPRHCCQRWGRVPVAGSSAIPNI